MRGHVREKVSIAATRQIFIFFLKRMYSVFSPKLALVYAKCRKEKGMVCNAMQCKCNAQNAKKNRQKQNSEKCRDREAKEEKE